MQKNDKSYTFLLKHSSKSKIYIKKIEVPKSLVHFGSVGLFLIVGVSTLAIGLNGFLRSNVLAKTLVNDNLATASLTAPQAGTETYNYNRPAASAEIAFNSGGPDDDIADGTNDSELETKLDGLRASADPAFIPNMWAHLGKINNEFGFRRNPFGGRAYEFHAGMDIDGERGDLVVAPANGIVLKAGWTGGYGNMIEVDHGNGLSTRYGHLSKIDAQAGDTITRGQIIGYVGSTGRSTGPHLHYEMRLNDTPINPRYFLPPEPTDLAKLSR